MGADGAQNSPLGCVLGGTSLNRLPAPRQSGFTSDKMAAVTEDVEEAEIVALVSCLCALVTCGFSLVTFCLQGENGGGRIYMPCSGGHVLLGGIPESPSSPFSPPPTLLQ